MFTVYQFTRLPVYQFTNLPIHQFTSLPLNKQRLNNMRRHFRVFL
jgi:hypothetical protein